MHKTTCLRFQSSFAIMTAQGLKMKWYEQRFVNRRDWILDHLEYLGLSEKETVLVLLMDFMNENRIPITIDVLAQRTGMSETDVDETIAVLYAKKYLDIRASGKRVSFRLDGLFETDVAKEESVIDRSVFDLFESEMKRPLTQKDMEKITDWNRTYDKRLVILALREASIYQSVSIPYIDKILHEWARKGLSAEMVEKGAGANETGRNTEGA